MPRSLSHHWACVQTVLSALIPHQSLQRASSSFRSQRITCLDSSSVHETPLFLCSCQYFPYESPQHVVMALSIHLPHRTVCSWWGLSLASHCILKHLSYSRLSSNTWIVTDFKREAINTMPAFAHCGLKRVTWTRNWVAYFNQGAKQFGLFPRNFHKTKCACIRHFLFQERIRLCICLLLCIPATNHLHLDPQLLCPFWLQNPLRNK